MCNEPHSASWWEAYQTWRIVQKMTHGFEVRWKPREDPGEKRTIEQSFVPSLRAIDVGDAANLEV